MKNKKGILFVISGPSGSGKTTLAEKLLKDKSLKNRLKKSISFTTRQRRTGERNKRDYFFISKEQFEQARAEKKILEWIRYLGYYYGTPKEFVDNELLKGRNLLFCVDLKGACKLKRFYSKQAVTIFIMPPSLKELKRRIEKRCNKTGEEEILRRLKLAEEEILSADKFDYCITNEDLNKTTDQLKEIILDNIRRN